MYIPKYICTTVLLFATPCPERLLPYKAFHTLAQLFACYEIISSVEYFSNAKSRRRKVFLLCVLVGGL